MLKYLYNHKKRYEYYFINIEHHRKIVYLKLYKNSIKKYLLKMIVKIY